MGAVCGCQPIRGQYPGQVITLDQSEASIQVPRLSAVCGCQISIRVRPQPQAAPRKSQRFCSANQRYFAMTQLGQPTDNCNLCKLFHLTPNCPSVLLFVLRRLISKFKWNEKLNVSSLKFSFVQTLKLRLFCLL